MECVCTSRFHTENGTTFTNTIHNVLLISINFTIRCNVRNSIKSNLNTGQMYTVIWRCENWRVLKIRVLFIMILWFDIDSFTTIDFVNNSSFWKSISNDVHRFDVKKFHSRFPFQVQVNDETGFNDFSMEIVAIVNKIVNIVNFYTNVHAKHYDLQYIGWRYDWSGMCLYWRLNLNEREKKLSFQL